VRKSHFSRGGSGTHQPVASATTSLSLIAGYGCIGLAVFVLAVELLIGLVALRDAISALVGTAVIGGPLVLVGKYRTTRHRDRLARAVMAHECELCGYKWTSSGRDKPAPVVPRPDLIAKGNARLEEEARRRRMWD
jgi:hypothetical protein